MTGGSQTEALQLDAPRPSPRPKKREPLAPYLFLSPYYLLTAVFFVYPLLQAVRLAFCQTNGPKSEAFVGLSNFKFLFQQGEFFVALRNTAVFAACAVALQLPLSLGLAMLLNSGVRRGRAFFRLLIFSPNLVGGVFVGFLFGQLFAPRFGMINRMLQELFGWGLEERWLQKPSLVLPAIVIASLWTSVGSGMVYFLAALQAVDKTLIDAARVDGATPLDVFRHVTLPAIRPVTIFMLVTTLIGSFQLFELPLALLSDGRGPQNAGLTVMNYLYDSAFRAGDLGLGSAIGWALALIIMAFSLLQLRVLRQSGANDE